MAVRSLTSKCKTANTLAQEANLQANSHPALVCWLFIGGFMVIEKAFNARCLMRQTDDCVLWLGNFDSRGYGRIHLTRKTLKAHRVSYCLANGIDINDIDGLVIMHSCDNPSCVNPRHLSASSQIDNVADRFNKSRCASGEKNGSSKLTIAQVMEIRAAYDSGKRGFGSHSLAKKYGVHHGTVLKIVRGELWNI